MSMPWLPDEDSGITIRIPWLFVPLVVMLALGLVIGGLSLMQRNRVLEADSVRLLGTARSAEGHERSLQATITQQGARLRERETELEMLRRHIEAIEVQLDGLDTLSRDTRSALGLSPSAGTWSEAAGGAPPQGGPAPVPGTAPEMLPGALPDGAIPEAEDHARLDLVQRRLAAGVGDMFRLAAEARARKAAAEGAPVAEPAPAPSGMPANWPARGDVSSPFGWRIFRGQPDYHTGIDVVLDYGTQVQATAAGLVVGSGWQPGYGWCVLVAHGEGYHTLYAHLSATAVAVGDTAQPGDVLGYSGSSGNSTGPHLHYEIWKDGQAVDPRPYMDGTGPG